MGQQVRFSSHVKNQNQQQNQNKSAQKQRFSPWEITELYNILKNFEKAYPATQPQNKYHLPANTSQAAQNQNNQQQSSLLNQTSSIFGNGNNQNQQNGQSN